MSSLAKNLLLAFLILFMFSVIFSGLFNPASKAEVIPFSQFVEKIKAGEVANVIVDNQNIIIKDKDGKIFRSQKESESSLTESFKNLGVPADKIAPLSIDIVSNSGATFWLTMAVQVLVPFLLIVVLIWYLSRQAQKGAVQAFNFGKANIRLFTNLKERVTFKDVAGLKEAKEELMEVVDFLRNPRKFLEIGARIPRGVLLMGAPGTGKTLLARAVAGEANVPFFHISGSEFVEMFVGVGAARVRDLFQTAKKAAPAIVFVDEIDAVGRVRGAGLGGGHDEREQTLNQILVEMDGFERDTNVIVIAATNRPDILDPALLRPGRFDRRVVLDLPDINEREQILRLHSKEKKFEPAINLKKIAERTPGFAGADLANLINEAAILAARGGRKVIRQKDLFDAMEKVILGPERKSHILSRREKEITAYHEAGHAVVAASLPHADPVHKISIVARGRAAGYTLKLPVEDRKLWTRSQFIDDLAVMLGGYTTEKIFFNEITTGASNDLQEASDLARRLVTQYGMSELGPVTFGRQDEMVFLGREIAVEKNYSEKVAGEIDREVKRFIKRAFLTAQRIVKSRRKVVERVAKRLMEAETIEREEFEALVGKARRIAPEPA